jgi:hypothetical protein
MFFSPSVVCGGQDGILNVSPSSSLFPSITIILSILKIYPPVSQEVDNVYVRDNSSLNKQHLTTKTNQNISAGGRKRGYLQALPPELTYRHRPIRYCSILFVVKVKVTHEQATKNQRESRGIALTLSLTSALDGGWVVYVTPFSLW